MIRAHAILVQALDHVQRTARRSQQQAHDGGTVDGTCVLVYADSRVQDVMLYFITSTL